VLASSSSVQLASVLEVLFTIDSKPVAWPPLHFPLELC
jgi:hypothetical protein